VAGGVDVVQVRAPAATARELLDLTLAVRGRIGRRARLVVNDRVDVALAAGADGVHLGERSLPPELARRLLGAGGYVGASVHSAGAALAAERGGADSVTFGHVFGTASHPDLPPRGLAGLREVAGAVRLPVIAIGGIDAGRVPAVLAHGAAGVAVISAILGAADPAEAARALRRALDTGCSG
jgi:thiamine-phosphate pyrophosphorylase